MNYLHNYLGWPIVVVFVLALIFLLIALTWLRKYINPQTPSDKKDFVQVVLVGLGAIIAVGSFLVAWSTLQESQTSAQQSQTIAQENLANSQKVAAGNAEATLLQSYLEQMNTSIANNLRTASAGGEKRVVARVQTLAILRALENENRKRLVIRYLSEAGLIKEDPTNDSTEDPVVDIDGANLVRADLGYINLSDTYLQHTLLNEAKLKSASLHRTNLKRADLSGACLRNAGLFKADLYFTGLEGADLANADLSGADLREAVGLTKDQINLAYGNSETQLPEGVTAPDAWSKPIEEQEENLKDEVAQTPEAKSCTDKPI